MIYGPPVEISFQKGVEAIKIAHIYTERTYTRIRRCQYKKTLFLKAINFNCNFKWTSIINLHE